MHDIETPFNDFNEFEDGPNVFGGYEFEDNYETRRIMNDESPFSENEEMEMAAELLEVTSDEELEQFLGNVIKKAAGGARSFLRTSAGKQLGGMLKGVAKKALPMLGRAAGMYFGGPAGAAIGGKLGNMAGQVFGLELEGLAPDELEFEAARKFVRLAGDAAKKTVAAGPNINPANAVQNALMAASRKHAPGLYAKSKSDSSCSRSGRWIRKGNKIILLGL